MSELNGNGNGHGSGLRKTAWALITTGAIGIGGLVFKGSQDGTHALREVTRQEKQLERIDANVEALIWNAGLKPMSKEEAKNRVDSRRAENDARSGK